MKNYNRVIAGLMAMLMIASTLPLNALAVKEPKASAEAAASAPLAATKNAEPVLQQQAAYQLTYDTWNGSVASAFAGGTGTESDPYRIENGSQLMYFAAQVNSGNSFTGKYISLKANLNMDMFTKGKTWTPVGTKADKPFMGHFDGECHEIINLNIAYDSGNEADSTVSYVGFFGYVKNASIKNFGINSYKLNQTYNYDTEIGGMVAHTESSVIENCYANGNISATFEDSNPLLRADVVTLNSVPTELNYTNAHGQGVIIDLTNHATNINKTMTIGGDVSAVQIKGKAGTVYTGFNIVISEHSNFSLYMELENVEMQGNSASGTIVSTSGRKIYLFSGGTSNSISSTAGSAINATQTSLCILGSADLTIRGADGQEGKTGSSSTQINTKGKAGGKGSNGQIAIVADNIVVNTTKSVTICGGDGGNGGDGGSSGQGTTGSAGLNQVGGTAGGTGCSGMNGGNGGTGATAIKANKLTIINGNTHLQGGTGGNGGKGGNGGQGGTGGDVQAGVIGSAAAGNGGNGGTGGAGGTGGNGGTAVQCTTVNVTDSNVVFENGIGGAGGVGGKGGKGGTGGRAKRIDYWFIVYCGWAGGGGTGGLGGLGGNGGSVGDATYNIKVNHTNTAQITLQEGVSGKGGAGGYGGAVGTRGVAEAHNSYNPNGTDNSKKQANSGTDGTYIKIIGNSGSVVKTETISVDMPLNMSITSASLSVGGFVGVLNTNTVVETCACVVNDVLNSNSINPQFEYNTATVGNFVGTNEGTLSNVICAYTQDNVLIKYGIDTWFGEHTDNRADASVTVLNNYTDAQGLVYDNGISAQNTVSQTCSVIGKVGTACDVVIPNYVFSGRFISEVTAIADGAFYESDLIKSVTCGSTVKTIGKSAFYGSSLTKIDTGNSVTTIGNFAFLDCNSLETAVLGDNVSQIGAKLFSGSSVKNIKIGKSLKDIPELAQGISPFGIEKTNSELKMYEVADENPKFSAENGILYEAFSVQGKKLKVAIIDVPRKTTFAKGIFTPQKTDANGNVTADNDYYIMRIYPNAFAHNTNIKEVHLDYIRDVGAGAFAHCTSLETIRFGQYEEANETFTILDQEYKKANEQYSTEVGDRAFENCEKLKCINLESNALTKIGFKAFSGCGKQSATPLSVTLGKNIAAISVPDPNDITGETELLSFANMMDISFASAFINANICEFKVVDGNNKFLARDGVLFYLPGEKVAGSDKDVLWLAVYPQNAGHTENGVFVPNDTYEITNSADSNYVITHISPEAFSGAKSLQTLTVGDGVQTVGRAAFQNILALHTLRLGKDVNDLAGSVIGRLLDGSEALREISVVAENMHYCDVDGVLMDKNQYFLIKYPAAKQGIDYVIPDTVQEISENAFYGNNYLRHVTIENEIVYMGHYVFHNCQNLSFIYFKKGNCPIGTVKEIVLSNTFNTTNSRTLVCYGESTQTWEALRAANGEYVGQADQSGNRKKLFQIQPYTAFPENQEELKTSSYYAVVVVDKSGALLNDINVEFVGSGQAIDTVNGISMFYNLDYSKPYTLRVMDNQGVYFPMENPEFYLDADTRITYITLSSVPTISGVSASYEVKAADKIEGVLMHTIADAIVTGDERRVVDINSEVAKINVWCVDAVTVTVNCSMDPDIEVTGYSLVQNGKVIQAENDPTVLEQMLTGISGDSNAAKKTFKLVFTAETSRLEIEQDLYAVVELSDGTQIQTKLNIHIIELDFYSIDLSWLSEGMSFELSDELINILNAFDHELEIIPKIKGKTPFYIKVEDDSFKIGYRYTNSGKTGWDENNPENFDSLEAYWDAFDTYKDAIKNHSIPRSIPFEYQNEGEAKISLMGYMQINYKGLDENGNKEFSHEAGMTGSLKLTYNFGTTYVFVIPIRVECELSAEGKVTYKFVFDREAEKFLTSEHSLELKGELTLSAGIGCRVLSAGVYGKAEMLMVFPNFELQKWTLSGDIGLYVKYDGLFVKWKKTWSILKALGVDAEWVIYENGKWWHEQDAAAVSEDSAIAAIYDESNYEIATSTRRPGTKRLELKGIETQDDSYTGIKPQMLQVGDLIYIVYHEDLNGYSESYDAYNYQKIVYQTYNIQTGEYSKVFVLDDNGYADGAYELYYDGDAAVIVYTQLNDRLSTNSNDDMSEYVGALEVKTAVLTDGVFSASADRLTNDEYYDMQLRVGTINGKTTAVWVQNAENSMFGTTDNQNMSIWYSVYDESVWSEPVCAKSGINTITDLEIGDNSIVYITDTNNDLTTVGADKATEGYADRKISVIDLSGNVLVQTAEEAAYHDVSYMDGKVMYYVAGNLYTLDTNAALFDSAIQELTEDYTALADANGDIKAILFVKNITYNEETGTDGSNIFGIFRNGDSWGKPVQITNFGEEQFVTAFDAVDFDDQILISALVSEIEYNEAAGEDEDSYITTNRFETQWYSYPTAYQLGEITFDYQTVKPGEATTVTVPVTNNGYEAMTAVPVSVVRNGSTIWNGTVSAFYDAEGNQLNQGLLSGTSGYIEVTFDAGNADASKPYTVSIGEESAQVQLWYSDFTVYAKQILIGDKYHIVARVTNNGYVPASYPMTAYLNDEAIWTTKTAVLGNGETQYFTIPLNSTLAGDGSDLVSVRIDTQDEYVFGNNEAIVNISTDEILSISTEALSVWLSAYSAKFDRSNPVNISFDFEDSYQVEQITIDEHDASGLYTVSGNTITLNAAAIGGSYANGTHLAQIKFSDGSLDENGSKAYRYANFTIELTQTFTVKWIVAGVEAASAICEAGEIPSYNAATPSRDADAQYIYSFAGWDANGDDIADPITSITANTVFTAVFHKEAVVYEIVWKLNDEQTETEGYTYGELPSYQGTPVKPATAEYEYVFKGWDREISTVTENAVYTAVYDQVTRNYSVTTVVDGVSTAALVPYGTVPVLESPTKASDAQYDYTFTGWSPAISTVYGNQTYTAEFSSTLRQYTVSWNVDGTVTESTYPYGTMPVYDGTPSKTGDQQYTYQFTGWDREITPVTSDTTYTAVFGQTTNEYLVSFVVNGVAHSEYYAYGSIPAFTGNTSKSPDEDFRYVFTGWDQELSPVQGEVTYTAQYDAIRIGSAAITNTSFETAWNQSFSITVSLSNVQNMTETVLTLHYDPSTVTLESFEALADVTIIKSGTGYIDLHVTNLSSDEAKSILKLQFITGEYAPVGKWNFLSVFSEDRISADFNGITICQVGDVNMDGRINTIDAAMIHRYALNKLTLSDVQKVYADVNGDLVIDSNDAAMLQRFAVKKLTSLGSRITVVFVDGENKSSISLVKGQDIDPYHVPADGYAWSASQEQYVSVDFTALTSDITVYLMKKP